MHSDPVSPPAAIDNSLALFDGRAFFEKALLFGLQHGILDAQRIATMRSEAPKGMVQIARYFGSEFLRPELERARARIVNLVSLHLEHSSAGDLRHAAELLRDHSLLSRSKAGSDMLKALIAMPQSSHFGLFARSGFSDEDIPQLAQWSLRSLADYQAEYAKRAHLAQLVDAALWLADYLGLEAETLDEAHCDAEAVIRSALLAMVAGLKRFPDWLAFEKMVGKLREKAAGAKNITMSLPKATQRMPEPLRAAVEVVHASVVADLPKILDATLPVRKLFTQTPAFMGRYFWEDDVMQEITHFERSVSPTWNKATSGHSDDSSLLTLFFCLAAKSSAKTLLNPKSASSLLRKVDTAGLEPALAARFISAHAPEAYQVTYLRMCSEFLDSLQTALNAPQDPHAPPFAEALALLQRECNVA